MDELEGKLEAVEEAAEAEAQEQAVLSSEELSSEELSSEDESSRESESAEIQAPEENEDEGPSLVRSEFILPWSGILTCMSAFFSTS